MQRAPILLSHPTPLSQAKVMNLSFLTPRSRLLHCLDLPEASFLLVLEDSKLSVASVEFLHRITQVTVWPPLLTSHPGAKCKEVNLLLTGQPSCNTLS